MNSSSAARRIDVPTPADDGAYPRHSDQLPTIDLPAGRYRLRFAQSREDLEAVLRLRFEVFNLELGTGLDRAFMTGLDEDELDASLHHVMVTHGASGEVVGTYRMQTGAMARGGNGFYSAGEFALDALPSGFLDDAVEVGRACVAEAHRNGRVLHLLWRGLAAYLTWNNSRYLFGCCSLPTQDAAQAGAAYACLAGRGSVHPTLQVVPVPEVRCVTEIPQPSDEPFELPPLFESYLRLGGKACGLPAIDRRFKTIDFFVVLDIQDLDAKTYRTFFRETPA